jgi:alpha-N-arabinofuranosidase
MGSCSLSADEKSAWNENRYPISNPSFEEMEGDLPRGWKTAQWRGKAELAVDALARSGSRSVRISSPEGADSAWTTVVPVRPYAQYRLSGWIRTEGLQVIDGKGALLNIHGFRLLQTKVITDTQDWTRVEIVFDSEANDALQINCLFGGWGKARGTAWFDDIELELLGKKELNPRISIDPIKILNPISPYIYGQFIEHLGRCIYGGIWAEMLEDRKFFYPVGSADSPWKAIGEPEGVRMNPIVRYAGVHSPDIRLKGTGEPAGIFQENLALVEGKDYMGRIVLSADPGAAPVEVSLVWGSGENSRQKITLQDLSSEFRAYPLAFKAGGTSETARLEISSSGSESFRVGAVSLMPADNIEGFRPEVLKLLRELDAPVYRWPGGNFVSGYNWKDGIGDPDRRLPRKNPAWQGIEHNDVGIHEFMAFCRLVGAEPYISVNSGQGDELLAAEEVEYVNGSEDTPMGRWRAQNGHPEPFGCKWWSIGNEMYGSWQLGFMPLEDYVRKHNRIAQAMRSKDPAIQLIAVGAVGSWSEGMLAGCGQSMDLISEHFYCGEGRGLLSHISQIPRNVRSIAEAHRGYRRTIPDLKGKEIPIALDEWNYWYGPDLYGEIGVRYFLKDGLGVAAGLHEYFRQSDIIFMANYAQTVNVIGAIKTTKTAAEFDMTGLVLKLYRAHYGTLPVKVSGAPEPLDVAAAWKEGKKELTVAIVNPTKMPQPLALSIKGARVPKTARMWRISSEDEMAFNEPGKEPVVKIQELADAPFSSRMTIPPLSISIYELSIRR